MVKEHVSLTVDAKSVLPLFEHERTQCSRTFDDIIIRPMSVSDFDQCWVHGVFLLTVYQFASKHARTVGSPAQ